MTRPTGHTRAERREIRQAEAQGRQAAYDALTTAEKIANLPEGGAKRQRARLEAQLASEKSVKADGTKSGRLKAGQKGNKPKRAKK